MKSPGLTEQTGASECRSLKGSGVVTTNATLPAMYVRHHYLTSKVSHTDLRSTTALFLIFGGR